MDFLTLLHYNPKQRKRYVMLVSVLFLPPPPSGDINLTSTPTLLTLLLFCLFVYLFSHYSLFLTPVPTGWRCDTCHWYTAAHRKTSTLPLICTTQTFIPLCAITSSLLFNSLGTSTCLFFFSLKHACKQNMHPNS